MIEEIEVLIGKLYYQDNLKRFQIVPIIKKIYGVEVTIEEIDRVIAKETKYQLGKPTHRYRKKVTSKVILQWLQREYTLEQIKEEAGKMNLELPEEYIKQAEEMYKEWKERYPNRAKKQYKSKRTNNGEEGR